MIQRPTSWKVIRTALATAVCMALPMSGHADIALPSANQIVEKNVAARGGLDAWRKVHSLSFVGKIDAGRTHPEPAGTVSGNGPTRSDLRPGQRRALLRNAAVAGEVIALPFRLEMKRPRKSRLEVEFAGETAVQTYDGTGGWKLRPYMGKATPERYTSEELKLAAAQQDLDGPLIDAAAKGSHITMEGMEDVDGARAYKLKVTLKGGDVRRVWVDTKTFLEVQVDGHRQVGGKSRSMVTRLSDYRRVDGVMIPFAMVTTGAGLQDGERIVVEKVTVNPEISDLRFSEPRPGGPV